MPNDQLPSAPSEGGLSVVGIGASAGGVHAIQAFFRHLPPDSGLAFVVILHLSPEYESQLTAILQTVTTMPVVQVTEAMPVDGNRVYVIPPGQHLRLRDGMIQPIDRDETHNRHAPIDLFFRSLAEIYGGRAAAIVLSGSGADGTLGIKQVKERGGLVLVQDPTEAEHDSMPRYALATGVADVVAPVAELPQVLTNAWHQATAPAAQPSDQITDERELALLRDVLVALRSRTGQDFSQYKQPTLLRRIRRRMQVAGAATLAEYLVILRSQPDEAPTLLRDLLISVTNFFRDPPAWQALAQALPQLFQGKRSGDVVRAWSVGCATGEEAYTLAMVLYEYVNTLEDRPTLQVFATDIHEHAIASARNGAYPETISVDVSAERLQRFFTNKGGQYLVRKELREIILFAPHNILRDPPFSRLDVITCRNLLIYIDRTMQEQILHLFHFTLQPQGLLLLGNSESTDGVPNLFTPLDKTQRLFQQRPAPWAPVVPFIGRPQSQMPFPARGSAAIPPSFEELAVRTLIQHGPPSLIVTEQYDIVHLARGAGRFLQLGDGTPSPNLLQVIHRDMRLELRTALYQVSQDGERKETRPVRLQHAGINRLVSLTVQPLSDPAWAAGHLLIMFHELADDGGLVGSMPSASEPLVHQLEGELQRIREQLRITTEQYETALEEHKAGNEELQALNEELRATTEELATSKEELQSINEELLTVNEELKLKIVEVSRAHGDLQNLMTATAIGTVFVDRELRIKRYTASVQAIINLIESDINRPLTHITHTLKYDHLIADVHDVLNTATAIERELESRQQRWYLMRIQPYRSETDQADGVVLTFIDITQRRSAEEALRISEERLRLLVERVVDYAIVTITGDYRIAYWNSGAERMFGYSEAEMLGTSAECLFTTEDQAAGMLVQDLQQALADGQVEAARWYVRKDGSRLYASGRTTLMRTTQLDEFAKVLRDITPDA